MDLKEIEKSAIIEINNAHDIIELESIRVKYLGRHGDLTEILKSLKDFDLKERKKIGPKANDLRQELEKLLQNRKNDLVHRADFPAIDITAPGKKKEIGHLHPISKVQEQIEEIFSSMGFSVAEGPEIETEFYNFDALNIPANHPARDMWDTLWLKSQDSTPTPNKKLLLRTHTSPVQIHYMETHQPPIRIIAPGRAFRYEASDASHEVQFYQLEGLMVDKNISFANFKSVTSAFLKRIFNKNVKIRFRLDYFPFVEPGAEIAVSCPRCSGRGCSLCKQSGWLEIAGAGMVHPEVFKAVGYNP
ncbi:MAG TPA: phenylalanine--tRNA ligase subunit alpha, partial [Candidatus Paceibacterota bacterium]|nr:phenylalanine--tRNA ligase subunit alpha [Candidatus Paceibacterota bacterium]